MNDERGETEPLWKRMAVNLVAINFIGWALYRFAFGF